MKEEYKTLYSKKAFVTIKDHKPIFPNSVDCRLISTMKSDHGKVAKVILDKNNSSIKGNTDLIQRKSYFEVIAWFDKLKIKITWNSWSYISALLPVYKKIWIK